MEVMSSQDPVIYWFRNT